MKTPQNGFLVIADITGYTAFLSQSELEHAEDSLRSLLDLLIEHTKPPLMVSRLEGDAVISYALQGSFLQGQTLVEMIEGTYVAFRRALELMMLNTTCTCNACQNIPNLDLKFFVHDGTFMLEPFPSYTELVGSDVNLVHRLTKNRVTEETGRRAYVLYTQAAIDGLGIHELSEQMTRHTETYEHIGEVITYVQDLHAVWDSERDRVRTFVQPEEALYIVEHDFPLATALMWDYVTKPEYKAILANSNRATVDNRTNGRIGPGATYYCAHGNSSGSCQTIVDWQPLEEYTYVQDVVMGAYYLITTRLIPIENGTKVAILHSKCRGGPLIPRKTVDIFVRVGGPRTFNRGLRNLHTQIEEEIAQGKVVQPHPLGVPSGEIETAITESLAAR